MRGIKTTTCFNMKVTPTIYSEYFALNILYCQVLICTSNPWSVSRTPANIRWRAYSLTIIEKLCILDACRCLGYCFQFSIFSLNIGVVRCCSKKLRCTTLSRQYYLLLTLSWLFWEVYKKIFSFFRRSWRFSVRKSVLRNFTELTGKHLCLFFIEF